MRNFFVFVLIPFFLSACVSDGFATGFADGLSGYNGASTSSYDPLDAYYERRAREANEIIIRENSPMCRRRPDLAIC